MIRRRILVYIFDLINEGKRRNEFAEWHVAWLAERHNLMNDFPVIGYPCFAHRILGSPGGKHCKSLKRNVWRGVVSPLKAVSLDIECRIFP